jgi:hypothetical protein
LHDFNARKELPNRKHLKLMSRADRLGIAAIGRAIAAYPKWEETPPERRGLFVGTNPAGTEPATLEPAMARSVEDGTFSVAAFGECGVPYVPPLWLVRGLSNNILGFSSSYWDIRGANGNRCEGRVSGLAAVIEGVRCIAEGRADVVVAGGADSLRRLEGVIPGVHGEGAAFVLLTRAQEAGPGIVDAGLGYFPEENTAHAVNTPELGACTGVVDLVHWLHTGGESIEVTVADPTGLTAWLSASQERR